MKSLDNIPENERGRFLQAGLSSDNSYFVLAEMGDRGIHIGYRPVIHKVSDSVFAIGGKLRVAYRYDGPNDVAVPDEIDAPMQLLKDTLSGAHPQIAWERESGKRLSGVVQVPVAFGQTDLDRYLKDEDILNLASHFLDAVANRLGVPMTGPKDIPGARSKLRAIFKALFHDAVTALYGTPEEGDDGTAKKSVGDRLGEVGSFMFRTDDGFSKQVAEFQTAISKPKLSVVPDSAPENEAATVVTELGDADDDTPTVSMEAPLEEGEDGPVEV